MGNRNLHFYCGLWDSCPRGLMRPELRLRNRIGNFPSSANPSNVHEHVGGLG